MSRLLSLPVRFNVRFPGKLAALIDAAARSFGMDRSEWLREAATEKLRRDGDAHEPPEIGG